MFERALAIDPDYVGARWNLAMLQLLRGDYAQGWINHEARWEGSPELRGKPRGGLGSRYGRASRWQARHCSCGASRDSAMHCNSRAMCR